jgi:hypothetical protein
MPQLGNYPTWFSYNHVNVGMGKLTFTVTRSGILKLCSVRKGMLRNEKGSVNMEFRTDFIHELSTGCSHRLTAHK